MRREVNTTQIGVHWRFDPRPPEPVTRAQRSFKSKSAKQAEGSGRHVFPNGLAAYNLRRRNASRAKNVECNAPPIWVMLPSAQNNPRSSAVRLFLWVLSSEIRSYLNFCLSILSALMRDSKVEGGT